jgi:streptogramin lyase/mono/diheme cytochrome c family protein
MESHWRQDCPKETIGMSSNKSWQAVWFATIAILAALPFEKPAFGQEEAGSPNSSINALQRTYQMKQYSELADRGPMRGENIYFYKCFVCHNHYAKAGPDLAGLFRRTHLTDGDVINNQTISAVIRKGAPGMPAYGLSLDDADIEDLLDYFKSDDCCYEAAQPPANPLYLAATQKWPVPAALRGGAHGLVRDISGHPLEGVKVQLIAPNGVRTTVSTNAEGKYEFPRMQAGSYVLRIATPLTYKQFQRGGVRVEGDRAFEDIVLDNVPLAYQGALPGALPPTAEIVSQLSGAELLWNLPGSNEEKTAFIRTCGPGCHDLKEILRNRFHEQSWRVIVGFMTSRGASSAFVVRPPTPSFTPDAEIVIKWLARVRGPDSKADDSYRAFPRAAGSSTNAVITEYELPRRFLSIHELAADSKGNLWYTSHRTPYVGMLDPHTGMVQEFRLPDIPGAFPGTYKVAVDPDDIVWFAQDWAQRLTRLDPVTGRTRQLHIEENVDIPLNKKTIGNFGLAPDGKLWSEREDDTIVRIDPNTGDVLQIYAHSPRSQTADNLLSADGRFWAGGGPWMGTNTGMILDIANGKMYETDSGDVPSSAARGGFDLHDNAWFGGHMGSLVEIVNEIDAGKGVHIRTFTPPTPYYPYSQFYSAIPDKNGEVWSAWIHGRGVVRFDSETGIWRVYDSPEPSAFARSTWVDNSTTPVTVWYPDYQLGTIVRIQPRD